MMRPKGGTSAEPDTSLCAEADEPAPVIGQQKKGPAEIALDAGEMAVVWDKGTPKAYGPQPTQITVGPNQSWAKLRNTKATTMQFLEISKLDGSVEHVGGPANRYTMENGKDPFTGEVITVKEQFQMRSKTDCLIVYSKERDGTYQPRVVCGPRMFMPQPHEYVAEFAWTHPETHEPGAYKFSYLSTAPQSLKLKVKNVPKYDDLYDVDLMLFFKIDPQILLEGPDDPIAELINQAHVDLSAFAASGGEFKPKEDPSKQVESEKDAMKGRATAGKLPDFSKLVALANSLGVIGVVDVVMSVAALVEKALTPLELLELKALENKLAIEVELQGLIAQQELQLAGVYAYTQNQIATVQAITQVEVDAMQELAGIAKGAGGSDKAYSRVAACCCCSVAVKTSGGVWAQIGLEGSERTNYKTAVGVNANVGVNSAGTGSWNGSLVNTVNTTLPKVSASVNNDATAAPAAAPAAPPATAPATAPAPANP